MSCCPFLIGAVEQCLLLCRCDLIHHVKTQAPYAILAFLASMFCGYIPAGYGLPAWAGLLLTLAGTCALGYFLSQGLAAEGQREDFVSPVWDQGERAVANARRLSRTLSASLKQSIVSARGPRATFDAMPPAPIPEDQSVVLANG
jgi:hypothetical protein